MKRILVIGVVLALILTLVLPSIAMAAKPATFSASGVMSSIDTGNVKPLGNSGLWLVKDRHIEGNFLSGDLGNAAYSITYGGVFKLSDQSGQLAGKLVTGSKTFVISGTVEPLGYVDAAKYGLEQLTPVLPILTISGHWTGLKGINATGSFDAYMVFIPDAEGHVLAIVDSAFIMTGKYVK